MKKTFTDKITQKVIVYTDDCLFTIETRSKFNSRVVKKVFNAIDIDKAFNEFYSLFAPEGHYKYLYMRPLNKDDKETLILRMKGHASQVAVENIVLKDKTPKRKMSTVSIANLTSCPASLAHMLSSDDFSQYPASVSRWSVSKIVYALLSYLMSLPYDEKMRLLSIADKEYLLHKEMSGYGLEEESLIKVDLVTKEDIN
jgi:hypothetical protein